MATYLIGDVQGCYAELQSLLKKIQFQPDQDRLCFVGDLVNRGPDSLKVLRFLKGLNDPFIVLGNHDLYLLIIGYELMPIDAYQHTLHEVMAAPDRFELIEWLRQRPLIKKINEKAVMLHAGIAPQWSVDEAFKRAREVEAVLHGDNFKLFLKGLFGNEPCKWSDHLQGQDRLRYITNSLTRMRYVTEKGELNLDEKIPPSSQESEATEGIFQPWFFWRDEKKDQTQIYFGHWAALNGKCNQAHCHALDTGCAWGYELTAIRLEDHERFSVSSVIAKNETGT